MLRKFALPVCLAGLFAVAGGSVATQQLSAGLHRSEADSRRRRRGAIGTDKLQCVTIAGTAYNGAVGQQKETGQERRLAPHRLARKLHPDDELGSRGR